MVVADTIPNEPNFASTVKAIAICAWFEGGSRRCHGRRAAFFNTTAIAVIVAVRRTVEIEPAARADIRGKRAATDDAKWWVRGANWTWQGRR